MFEITAVRLKKKIGKINKIDKLRGSKDEGDDHSVESQDFGEDKNKDHSDEETWLLGGSTDSGVSDDSDGVSGSQSAQSARETGGQVGEPFVQVVSLRRRVHFSLQHHRDDQTVDTDDTGHNDWNDGLHDELRTHHSH